MRQTKSVLNSIHWYVLALVYFVYLFISHSLAAQTKPVEELTRYQNREVLLRTKFKKDLLELADWCETNQLSQEAQHLRRRFESVNDTLVLNVPILTGHRSSLPKKKSVETTLAPWQRKYRRIQNTLAAGLFQLAQRARKAGYLSYAYNLILEVPDINPNHSNARSILGYVRYQGNWTTFYDAQQRKKGWTWDNELGWVKKKHLKQYQQGLRFYQNEWIPADQETSLRQNLDNGWEIRTEHFNIVTNHSLEAAVTLSYHLEDLFYVFQRFFSSAFINQTALEQRLRRRANKILPPFQVIYFRSRQDYLTHPGLRSALGDKLAFSSGAYLPHLQTSFFYYAPESDNTSVLHEATHQLFSESYNLQSLIAVESHFWLVEGIACYMESLHRTKHALLLGGSHQPRFQDARDCTLNENFQIPLRELSGWGIESFQNAENLVSLYSQATGLTYFLMHYQSGRYRPHLLACLRDIYTKQDTTQSLEHHTQVSYEDLDQQYHDFLEQSDE